MVIAETAILPFLRERFGERSMSAEPVDEHRTRIRVTAPTETLLARSLASWGDHLEVVEPESLRVELKRLGSELARRN